MSIRNVTVTLLACLPTPMLLGAHSFVIRMSRLQLRPLACFAFFSKDFQAKERLLPV